MVDPGLDVPVLVLSCQVTVQFSRFFKILFLVDGCTKVEFPFYRFFIYFKCFTVIFLCLFIVPFIILLVPLPQKRIFLLGKQRRAQHEQKKQWDQLCFHN